MSKNVLRWLPLVLALVAAPAAAQQIPTPENTSISNTATVTYTDALGNPGEATSNEVTILVAFKAGIDVGGQPSANPGAVSTGNDLPFTIVNAGNGTDFVTISIAHDVAAIEGYRIGGATGTPLTLAQLNAALASPSADSLTYGNSATPLVIHVIYSMNSSAGVTKTIELIATSNRQTGVSDSYTTNVTPAVAGGVIVSSPGAVSQLPGVLAGTTTYSATFNVENYANVDRTYNLTAAIGAPGVNGVVITNVTVNGGPVGTLTSATPTLDAQGGANDNVNITVTYQVPNGATNSAVQSMTLTASWLGTGPTSHSGTLTVTVIKPILTVAKAAYRSNMTTIIDPSSPNPAIARVIPGEDIWYRLQVTNIGTAPAQAIVLTDALNAQLGYQGVSTTVDPAWSVTSAPTTGTSGTVTLTRAGTLAAGANSILFIGVEIR